MTNTRNAKQKARTHFEQVPLPIVKKAIAEAVKPAKTGAKNLTVEAARSKTEPYRVARPIRSLTLTSSRKRRADRDRSAPDGQSVDASPRPPSSSGR